VGQVLRSSPYLIWSATRHAAGRARLALALAAVALVASAVLAALLARAGPPARLVAGAGDTVLVNYLRPVPLPTRVLDAAGRLLPDTGVRYAWVAGAPVSVSARGVVTCARRGDATVRASLGPLATTLLVRCRPVRDLSAGGTDFVLGDPPRDLPLEAVGVDGRPVTLLGAWLTVEDTTVATLDGLRVHPRSPGETMVNVRVGDRTAGTVIRVFEPVRTIEGLRPDQRLVVAPVRLARGASVRWRLPTGRFYLSFLPGPDAGAAPTLSVDGAVMCMPALRPGVSDTRCSCASRARGSPPLTPVSRATMQRWETSSARSPSTEIGRPERTDPHSLGRTLPLHAKRQTPMSTRTTRTTRLPGTWSGFPDATARALCMALACGIAFAERATCQTSPAGTVTGIEVTAIGVADSLVSAEFAKDSLGSLTVGVIAGSRLAWTRSVGFADMRARRLADRNTVYRIGSVTKPFTAVMLMQLVATGRVRMSDPVERYLPEVRRIAARPKGAAPFTFLQLATMTAGLAREPDDAGPFWTGPVSAWEKTLLAALPHTRYASSPGTEYSYSNVGYAILGAALGRAAGQPYVEWERAHLLRPLGMTRTGFELDPTITPDLAVGYQVDDDGTLNDTTAAREARDGRGYKVPNGAIFTTVDDLARFVSFELGQGPDSVLARSALDDAFGGLVATDAFLETGYGLGFKALQRDGFPILGHDGSTPGYRAAMYYDRNAQLGVVVFSNVFGGKQDPNHLAVDILATLAAAYRAEIQADINRRVKAQVPSTRSEAAVRRIIDELRLGKPDYDRMSPDLARQTRHQLTEEQATITNLGALQSLTFVRVGTAGPDIYRATFAKGTLEWRIWLSPEGRVDFFNHRAVSPSK
jgi:CubicO group peptidase (beta-lactamase class C family)